MTGSEPIDPATPAVTSSDLAIALAVAVGSILIRIPLLDVPMINDEGGYAYVAHFLGSDYQLYRDIPFYRPQAIFYLYRLILATLGDDVVAMRLFGALWNALTTVAVFLLGRELASRRVALIAAVSFAVFSAAPSIEGFTANAEIFAQLPIVLSALFAWRKKWVWAGAMAAGAVLLKPSGLSALLLAVGWVFVTGASLRGVIRVGAAFGLVLIPSVLHGSWIGWEHYWESMYTRRAAYADANSIGLRTQLGRFLLGVLDTAPSWAVPATLSGIAVTAKLDRARGFLLLWLGTSVVGMAMGSFWFRHYFIQAIPPLAILGAMGLSALATRRRRWIWVVPIAASIAVFSWDVFLWSRPAAETSLRVYGRPAYLVADEAADYVAANTVPSDRIFVAFSQAEIYYLSRRKASFPHMYYADFVYSERLFQEALASIREGEPAMVLVVQPPPVERMSMDDFIGILDEGYELVRTVQTPVPDARPILIYRRRALDGRS